MCQGYLLNYHVLFWKGPTVCNLENSEEPEGDFGRPRTTGPQFSGSYYIVNALGTGDVFKCDQ